MKILACGVRGTKTVADAEFLRYGGDTTCFLVEGADGSVIVVDAGSGLRTAQRRLTDDKKQSALMLLTHYHLDHLVGLTSFAMFYKPGWSLEIAGPHLAGGGPAAVIPRLFEPPFWPVPMTSFRSPPTLTTLLEPDVKPREHGGLQYRWHSIQHPGGCLAYRIDEPSSGDSVVVATDFEWAAAKPEAQQAFVEFCHDPAPVRWLLMDGHYIPEVYESHRGWGHSRWTDCVEAAERCGAKRLFVIHHSPRRNDRELARVEAALQARSAGAALLRQGQEIAASCEAPA